MHAHRHSPETELQTRVIILDLSRKHHTHTSHTTQAVTLSQQCHASKIQRRLSVEAWFLSAVCLWVGQRAVLVPKVKSCVGLIRRACKTAAHWLRLGFGRSAAYTRSSLLCSSQHTLLQYLANLPHGATKHSDVEQMRACRTFLPSRGLL